MVKVRNKIIYIFREFLSLLFNCAFEAWHFIKIILKDATVVIVFCSVMAVLITKPIWSKYNDFAKEKIVNTGIETYRMFTAPELSVKEAQTLTETTDRYILRKDIPDVMVITMILNIDPSFEKNKGVDIPRLVELVEQIKETQGNVIIDTDTLAEKVVDTVFLEDEKGFDKFGNKIFMALKLEQCYSKDSILEMYFNVTDCANDTKGIQQGAYKYFGKDVRELSLRQQMILCVILLDARDYNPKNNIAEVNEKCNALLERLYNTGNITEEEYTKALNEKVQIIRDK